MERADNIILPGDLVFDDSEHDSSIYNKMLLSSAITTVEPNSWAWAGDVVEVMPMPCIAVVCLDILNMGSAPIFIVHPFGCGWVDTSEVTKP